MYCWTCFYLHNFTPQNGTQHCLATPLGFFLRKTSSTTGEAYLIPFVLASSLPYLFLLPLLSWENRNHLTCTPSFFQNFFPSPFLLLPHSGYSQQCSMRAEPSTVSGILVGSQDWGWISEFSILSWFTRSLFFVYIRPPGGVRGRAHHIDLSIWDKMKMKSWLFSSFTDDVLSPPFQVHLGFISICHLHLRVPLPEGDTLHFWVLSGWQRTAGHIGGAPQKVAELLSARKPNSHSGSLPFLLFPHPIC